MRGDEEDGEAWWRCWRESEDKCYWRIGDLKDDSKQKIESKRARRMEELCGTVAGGLPSCLTRAIVSSFINMYDIAHNKNLGRPIMLTSPCMSGEDKVKLAGE